MDITKILPIFCFKQIEVSWQWRLTGNDHRRSISCSPTKFRLLHRPPPSPSRARLVRINNGINLLFLLAHCLSLLIYSRSPASSRWVLLFGVEVGFTFGFALASGGEEGNDAPLVSHPFKWKVTQYTPHDPVPFLFSPKTNYLAASIFITYIFSP